MAFIKSVSAYYYLTTKISKLGWLSLTKSGLKVTNDSVREPPQSGTIRLIPASIINNHALLQNLLFKVAITENSQSDFPPIRSEFYWNSKVFSTSQTFGDELRLFLLSMGGSDVILFDDYLLLTRGNYVPSLELEGLEEKLSHLLNQCFHQNFSPINEITTPSEEKIVIVEGNWTFELAIECVHSHQCPRIIIP